MLDMVFANNNQRNRVCLGDGTGGFTCGDVSMEANNTYSVAVGNVILPLIFADDLESGDTSAWSSTEP